MALPDIDLSFLGNINFSEGPAKIVKNLAALGLTTIALWVGLQMMGFDPKEQPLATLPLTSKCYTLKGNQLIEYQKGLINPLDSSLTCLGSVRISDQYGFAEKDRYVDWMSFNEQRLPQGIEYVVQSISGEVQFDNNGQPKGIKNSLITQQRADLNKIRPFRGGSNGVTPNFQKGQVEIWSNPYSYLETVTPAVAKTNTPTPTHTATPGPSPTPTLSALGEFQKTVGEGVDQTGKFIQSLIPWALGLAGALGAGAVALAGRRMQTNLKEQKAKATVNAEEVKKNRKQRAYSERKEQLIQEYGAHQVRIEEVGTSNVQIQWAVKKGDLAEFKRKLNELNKRLD